MRKLTACLLLPLTAGCEPAAELADPPVRTFTTLRTWNFPDGPWSSAGAALLDSSGVAIVGFSGDDVILALAPTGEVLWRQGRSGTGPGEFTSIGSISAHGDTLFVADYAQQRIVSLTRDGEIIGTTPVRVPGFGGFHRLGGGDLVFSPFPPAASPQWREGMTLLRLTADGAIADTLALYDQETFQITVTHGADQFFTGQPLSQDPIVRTSAFGDAVVIVDRPAPDESAPRSVATVTWIDMEGDTVATERAPFPPVPLSGSMRDSLLAGIRASFPALRSVREAAVAQAFLPAILPPVTRVQVGGQGEVWLRGAQSEADSVTWMGVAPGEGAFGALRLPASSRILASHGCYLLLSHLDALEVESLSLATLCDGDGPNALTRSPPAAATAR